MNTSFYDRAADCDAARRQEERLHLRALAASYRKALRRRALGESTKLTLLNALLKTEQRLRALGKEPHARRTVPRRRATRRPRV